MFEKRFLLQSDQASAEFSENSATGFTILPLIIHVAEMRATTDTRDGGQNGLQAQEL